MLEAAVGALDNLSSCPCVVGIFPARLVFLFFGVLVGLSLGAIPGLGGIVGLAILLPFTFALDPYAAFAMMIGLISVTSTSDTIPSVLFGVPGTVASQATILDGHPMAKKGEAGRAFGAAYTASLLGGLFGALVLALSIPILRPVVLAFGSPEFFMMGLLGISMVAVLSGGAPVKGLIAGAAGLTIGMIGADPQAAFPRWAFDALYLWDGIPLVPVTLGVFAIPEIVDLAVKGTRIADVPQGKTTTRGVLSGISDGFRHWFLVLRCSTIGVWVGAVPGMGASVVDWFAYGHAVQTEKGASDSFGKGDVRGVIAPESANNAKEGGGLIPTIAFGVPGSASMALLLAAFLIQGLVPGPDMLTKHLDITYTMIWSLALANIMGTAICLAFTPQLAKVAMVRIHLLAPLVIAIIFLAAFQASTNFGDLITLMSFSSLGWLMKRFGWPRPPLILGLVLSGILERYLFISVRRYGLVWLVDRPLVLAIALITIISVWYGLRRSRHERKSRRIEAPASSGLKLTPSALFTLVIFLLFSFAVFTASGWSYQTRMFPWAIGIPAMSLSLVQFGIEIWRARRPTTIEDTTGIMDLPVDRSVPVSLVIHRAANMFGWLFGLFAAVWLVGFLIAVPLFMVLYLTFQAQEKWWVTLASTACVMLFVLGVFHYVIHVPWLEGAIAWPQEMLIGWIGR